MRNEFIKYTVDSDSVTGGMGLALRFRCAKPAPFTQPDWTVLKKT